MISKIKNVIILVIDSLRQDHLSFYNGGKPVFEDVKACETPNLDRFAKKSIVFTNMHPSGLPTIPVRTEILTGRFSLPHRPWKPLQPYPEDISASEILGEHGFTCGLISDTYHLFKPDMNFHRGFHEFRWIRGQEYDAYFSSPTKRDVSRYVNLNYNEQWRKLVAKCLANTDYFKSEEDYFAMKVVRETLDWLKRNRAHDRKFLWMDMFDPHEPWDPPPRFDEYTNPNYEGSRLILPMGGYAENWATYEEITYIRGLYAGEVSFVDYCLGILFEGLDDLGYMSDSIIILTADHGHPLADHGKFLKGTDRLYNELLKVPFMIYYPDCKHRVMDALAQFPDILPTILDVIGLENETKHMNGRSFRRILVDESNEHRDVIIAGYHEGEDRCVRDKTWSYILRPEGLPDELYNLIEDPKELRNLIDERKDMAMKLYMSFGRCFYRKPARIIKGIQGQYELEHVKI
ncbi:MAG: sulfatase [Candidatus Bathyarchaeia archaeon]